MTAATPAVGAVAAPVVSEESQARGAALQRYLDARNAGVRVTFCARLSGGYETFIYEVHLEAADGAAPALPVNRRLILRIYHGPDVVARSGWENAVIARVRQDGIPAPEVFLYEPGLEPLGGPFLLLEFMRGKRMDEAALNVKPVAVIRMIRAFARAQAAVYRVQWPEAHAHAAAAAGELGPLAWSGDRLGAARREILARNLQPLLPIVDWLEEHQHVVAGEPAVLIHGDFHPLNLFVDGTEICGIIDWGSGGFANRHEDMGWSSLLIGTVTAADPAEDRRLAPFRTIARKVYLGFLWKSAGVDREQLRYGEVYAGLRWMLIFLPTYLPNAGEPLLNPDAIAFTTPQYVRRVRRFIEQRTGLTLGIV